MAVIQISKIQVRRGLQENLPQLASGELGWSIDERRLYIGNGTLVEGAPEVGVTEILTEYSADNNAADIALLQSNVSILQSYASLTSNNVAKTTLVLANNIGSATNTALTLTDSLTNLIDYRITRGIEARVGTIKVTQISGNVAVVDDEYTETGDTGVNLSFFAYGNSAVLQYTTTNTSTSANLTFYSPRTFA
jgi:hypothetical protein